MKYTRTSSICPTPEEILWEACRKNNIETIENVVIENPNILDYVYEDPPETTILLRACLDDEINGETVDKLIKLGAKLDDTFNGQKALHLAAQNTRAEILEIILKKLPPGCVNDLNDGDNALHTLINYGDSDSSDFAICAQMLIKHGISVNKGNGKNISPILLAAKKGYKNIIKTIIEESIEHVDLDNHKLANGKTARDLIIDKRLYPLPLPEPSRINNNDPKELLVTYLNTAKEDNFINLLKRYPDLKNADDGCKTMLQSVCEKGLIRAVETLLDLGANVNLVKSGKSPVELAAKGGYFEVLSVLLRHPDVKISAQILCDLLKSSDGLKFDRIDHEKCCELVMEAVKCNKNIVDLNGEDEVKNTPLHYAVRYSNQEKIEELLKLGASLAHKNRFGYMPIQDIEPSVLESHLDNCIKFDDKLDKRADNEDFEVVFDFSTLVPPRPKHPYSDDVEDPLKGPDTDYVNETEAIYYMSQTNEFRHLLQHPVIVTFLFLKWFSIRWLFYANLTFYFTFVVSLFCYIFSHYGNFDASRDTFVVILLHLSLLILWITFIFLLLRELFQMAISWDYFKNFENYIELCLIVVVALILVLREPSDDSRRQLSSIAILLSAFGLILLVGQHPNLSTNVVMLRRVSLNFFQLLAWYSVLIVAFALSFHILFSETPVVQKVAVNETSSGGDEDNDSFTSTGGSIFKTIIMLTGEFDAGSMNFHTYPVLSKIIFSLFIFMITIILLNLLNGLAVSDTASIKSEAELVGLICRVHHIHYVESMVLGNILPTNLIKCIQNVCCCFPFNPSRTLALAKPLARHVCLGPNFEFRVYPNNHGKISWENTNKNYTKFSALCLDRRTIIRTNSIVHERRRRNNNNLNLSDLRNVIAEMQTKLNDLLKKLPQRD